MTSLESVSRKERFDWLASKKFRLFLLFWVCIVLMAAFWGTQQFIAVQANQQQQLTNELTQQWGTKQQIVGPLLVLPYVEHITSIGTITDANGENRVASKDIYNDHTAILLPQQLDIRADLKPTTLQNAPVYTANIVISGNFDHEALVAQGQGDRSIQWDKAYVVVGLDDTRSLDEDSSFTWNNNKLTLAPSTQLSTLLQTGIHIPYLSNPNKSNRHDFKLTLNVQGSEGLQFAPLGDLTKVRITSSWTKPLFLGNTPPTKQILNEQGFNAEWKILPIVRDYPQTWDKDDKANYNLKQSMVGTALQAPTTVYQQLITLLPFGFLAFLLLALLLFAWDSKRFIARCNSLHYLTIGLAFVAFYPLLLVISSYFTFVQAYILSAASIIVVMTAYIAWLLRKSWQTLLAFTKLILLYAGLYGLLLYPTLQLAAGIGAIILTLLLLMYISYQTRTQLLPFNSSFKTL